MKSLPSKFFGPSGVPCLFAIDDEGNTAVGYLTKQIGSHRFLVSNGDVVKLVSLAQNALDVTDLMHLAPGLCTILVQSLNGDVENISRITEYRCTTLQRSDLRRWHNADPTEHQAGIIIPSLQTPFLLLEDGGLLMMESGDFIELEGSAS